MKSFFQRIQESHSGTRKPISTSDPNVSYNVWVPPTKSSGSRHPQEPGVHADPRSGTSRTGERRSSSRAPPAHYETHAGYNFATYPSTERIPHASRTVPVDAASVPHLRSLPLPSTGVHPSRQHPEAPAVYSTSNLYPVASSSKAPEIWMPPPHQPSTTYRDDKYYRSTRPDGKASKAREKEDARNQRGRERDMDALRDQPEDIPSKAREAETPRRREAPKERERGRDTRDKDREKERERDKDRQRERDRERDENRARKRERAEAVDKGRDRERERDRVRVRNRDGDRGRDRDSERGRDRDTERETHRERERGKAGERLQERDGDGGRPRERDRDRIWHGDKEDDREQKSGARKVMERPKEEEKERDRKKGYSESQDRTGGRAMDQQRGGKDHEEGGRLGDQRQDKAFAERPSNRDRNISRDRDKDEGHQKNLDRTPLDKLGDNRDRHRDDHNYFNRRHEPGRESASRDPVIQPQVSSKQPQVEDEKSSARKIGHRRNRTEEVYPASRRPVVHGSAPSARSNPSVVHIPQRKLASSSSENQAGTAEANHSAFPTFRDQSIELAQGLSGSDTEGPKRKENIKNTLDTTYEQGYRAPSLEGLSVLQAPKDGYSRTANTSGDSKLKYVPLANDSSASQQAAPHQVMPQQNAEAMVSTSHNVGKQSRDHFPQTTKPFQTASSGSLPIASHGDSRSHLPQSTIIANTTTSNTNATLHAEGFQATPHPYSLPVQVSNHEPSTAKTPVFAQQSTSNAVPSRRDSQTQPSSGPADHAHETTYIKHSYPTQLSSTSHLDLGTRMHETTATASQAQGTSSHSVLVAQRNSQPHPSHAPGISTQTSQHSQQRPMDHAVTDLSNRPYVASTGAVASASRPPSRAPTPMGQIHTTNDANTYLQSQPAHGAISEQPAQRGSSTNVGFPEATVLGKPSSQYHGVSSAQSKGPTSASHTAVQSASHPFVATKAYVTSSLPYTLAPALRNQQPSQQDYSRAVPTIVQPTMDHITYQKARFDQSATHSLVALKGSDSESTAYVHAQPSGAQPITKRQSQQYKTTEPVASHSGEKTSQSFGLSKGVATAAQPSTASHTRDQKIYDTTKTSVQELNTEGHMFPSQHPQMPTIAAFQTYPAHRDEQPSHSYDTLKNINNPLPLPSLSASRLSSNPEVTSVLPNGDSKLHSASQHAYSVDGKGQSDQRRSSAKVPDLIAAYDARSVAPNVQSRRDLGIQRPSTAMGYRPERTVFSGPVGSLGSTALRMKLPRQVSADSNVQLGSSIKRPATAMSSRHYRIDKSHSLEPLSLPPFHGKVSNPLQIRTHTSGPSTSSHDCQALDARASFAVPVPTIIRPDDSSLPNNKRPTQIYAAPVDHLVALGPDIITAVPSAVPVPANYSCSRENLPTPGQPMIPPPRTVSRAGFKDRHNPAPTYHLPKPIVEDLPSLSQPQPPVSRGAINNETFVPYAPGERSKAGHSSQEYPVPQRSEHLEKLANYRSVADRPSQATQHLVTEHSGLQAYRAPIQHAQLAELLSSPAPLNTRERAPVNITGVGVLSSIATPSQPLQADVASLSTRPYAIPPQPVLCTAKGRHSPSKAPHDVDNYPNITRASVQLAHSIPPQPGTSISQAHHSPPKALDEADSQLNVARAQPSHAMPLQQVPSASNARLSPSKVPDEIDNRPSVARTIHAIPQQPVPSSSRVRHSPSKPPREVDNRPIVLDVAEPRKVQSESNRHPPSPKGSIRQISAQPLPPPSHTHSREPSTSPQPSRTDPHLEQRHVLSEPAKSAPPPQPSSHRVPEPQPLSSRNRELGRSSHKQQPASASSTFPAHLEKSAQPTETPSTAPPVPPIGHRVTEPKPPSSRNHEPSKSTHKQQSASASYTYPAHLEKSAPQIETSSTAPPVAPTSHRVPEPQPPSSRNHEPSKSTHKQQSASASYTYPAHLEKSAPQIETSSTAPPVAPTSHRVPEPQPSSRNREPGRSSHKQQPALALSTYPAHLEKGTPQIETPSAVPPVPPIVTEPQPPSSRNHDPGPSSHKQQFASASSTYPAHLLHTETPSTAPSVPPTSHKVIETQPSSLRNPDPSKASHKQQSASTSHNLSASTYPIQSSASRSQPTTTEMNHRTQRTDSSRPRERTTSGPSNDLAASNVDPSSSRHVPSSLYTSQARAPRTQSVSIPSTNVPPPAVEATTAFRTQPTTSTRTIIPPPNSELRSDAVPQAHVSSSARVPASGPLPTSYRPTKVSKKTSEDSILKTPSSLAPSTLKPTVSRTSIPASLSSQPERKRGLFSIFRTKSSQAPALTEEVVPERTRKDSKEKKGLLRKAEVSSTEKLPPPGDTKVRDTNVVSSLAARVNPPPPITVPIPINPSTTPDRMSPNSKPFTPFRYLTQKRNRTMSAASLEAQDGTAPNTVVGSPTASMHSTQPPIQPPPLRDPFIATQEWRKQEAAEIREVATGKWRRARPGVVFDVEEDPRDDQKRRPVPRVKPSTPKADSPKTENSS